MCLSAEPLHLIVVVLQMWVKDLKSNNAFDRCLLGAVHTTHTTMSEFTDDPVGANAVHGDLPYLWVYVGTTMQHECAVADPYALASVEFGSRDAAPVHEGAVRAFSVHQQPAARDGAQQRMGG